MLALLTAVGKGFWWTWLGLWAVVLLLVPALLVVLVRRWWASLGIRVVLR